MEFYFFFLEIFAKKNFYLHFCLLFTQNVEFDKKNSQKYIYDVKFPITSNPACRIGLSIEENPKIRIFIEKFIPQKQVFKLAQTWQRGEKL